MYSLEADKINEFFFPEDLIKLPESQLILRLRKLFEECRGDDDKAKKYGMQLGYEITRVASLKTFKPATYLYENSINTGMEINRFVTAIGASLDDIAKFNAHSFDYRYHGYRLNGELDIADQVFCQFSSTNKLILISRYAR